MTFAVLECRLVDVWMSHVADAEVVVVEVVMVPFPLGTLDLGNSRQRRQPQQLRRQQLH